MGSASCEAVGRQARLEGQWRVLAKRRNTADLPLHDSPEGSHLDDPIQRCSPCKGHAIHYGLRLVLDHPGDSEPIKPPLLDY